MYCTWPSVPREFEDLIFAGAVTGDKNESTVQRIRRTYAVKGIKVSPCKALPRSAVCVPVSCLPANGQSASSGAGEVHLQDTTFCGKSLCLLQGFYPGGTAIAFRQMTNWASRQGFTEAVRDQFKLRLHGSKTAKLTKTEEVGSGILGGAQHFAQRCCEVDDMLQVGESSHLQQCAYDQPVILQYDHHQDSYGS